MFSRNEQAAILETIEKLRVVTEELKELKERFERFMAQAEEAKARAREQHGKNRK